MAAAPPEGLRRLSEPQPSPRDWPLVVRRARASDEAAVLAFASDTWDGWDYIPHAWPVWLEAKDGVMLVGHRPQDETPVALTRVAMVSPTEAWLEGIRVDPEMRGLGVASDLQVAELQWAAAQGASVIRYATSARNEGSHRLGARHGIELLFGLRNYWWSPEPGDPHDPSGFDADVRAEATAVRKHVLNLLAVQEGEAEIYADWLWNIVSKDAAFQSAKKLYEPRPWALGELVEQRFRRHVERAEVMFDDHEQAVAIVVRELLAGEDSSIRLALLVGDVHGMIELVEGVRIAAHGKTIRFRLPLNGPLANEAHDQLIAAGYQTGEWDLHILGRPIDSTHPIPEVDPARLVLSDPPARVIQPLDF